MAMVCVCVGACGVVEGWWQREVDSGLGLRAPQFQTGYRRWDKKSPLSELGAMARSDARASERGGESENWSVL